MFNCFNFNIWMFKINLKKWKRILYTKCSLLFQVHIMLNQREIALCFVSSQLVCYYICFCVLTELVSCLEVQDVSLEYQRLLLKLSRYRCITLWFWKMAKSKDFTIQLNIYQHIGSKYFNWPNSQPLINHVSIIKSRSHQPHPMPWSQFFLLLSKSNKQNLLYQKYKAN